MMSTNPLMRSSTLGTRTGSMKSGGTKGGKAGTVPRCDHELLLHREDSEEFVIKYDIKRLSSWFHSWQAWQQRLMVCTAMNLSSKQQLMMLATSLEPILHMDFCSILAPPFQSLHLDGVALFHNRRTVTHDYTLPEIIPEVGSQDYLQSLPSTFCSKKATLLSKLPIENLSMSMLRKTLSQIETPASKIATTNPGTRSSNYLLEFEKPSNKAISKTASKANRVQRIRKKEPILPALPLTHPDHLPTPVMDREASFDRMLRRQRFSSVPEFQSTMDLIKKSGRRFVTGRNEKGIIRRKTVSTYYTQSWQQKAEQFKDQLAQVTRWMTTWEELHKSYLLAELVKLCDKDLLGYFVQCLHQKLSDTMDVNSLPDSILTRIFGYLDPRDLCAASQVCKHWNECSNVPILWKRHAYLLGLHEGVGNIAEVVESVIKHYRHALQHSREGDEPVIDWKTAYRDILKLVSQMKQLVLKTAGEEDKCELEERLRSAAESHLARNKLSIIEMLEILRIRCTKSSATTHELYMMAPESATAVRRRLRAKKRAAMAALADRKPSQSSKIVKHPVLSPIDAWTPTHNLEFAQQLMMSIREADASYNTTLQEFNVVLEVEPSPMELEKPGILGLSYAEEFRPSAPHLPDANAIACLILCGGLLSDTAPRLGTLVEFPRVRRIERLESAVMCMQCDSRKIVAGTLDRTINIYDIRSGRPVTSLTGHKGSVQCLQFDDYKIISGSWDTTCIVWDVVHFKMLQQLHGHSECVSCLQFDEDILVTGSHDGSLHVWSTSSWDIITIMSSAHLGGVMCLKMNDRVIVSGGIDKTAKVWSFTSHQCLKVLQHDSPVVTFGLSQLLLLSCCINGNINFWNLDTFQPMIKMRTGNGAYMRQLAQFSTKFYGAGSDGVIYELDVSTGTCLRTLKGHSMIVTAISFAENKLVSASADKTIVTWHFDRPVPMISRKRGEENVTPGGEEEENEEEEGIDSSADFTIKDCRSKSLKFFHKFPLHHLVDAHGHVSLLYNC